MQERLDNFEQDVLGGSFARPDMERDIGKEAR
jgi:hypothetical protein